MPRTKTASYGKFRRSKEQISEEQIQRNLLALLESTNYNMVQENGQRKYGGPCPGWNQAQPPSSDCEVFVNQIPDTCFEDVLVPIFSSVGKIYELRLMLDFDGSHRGFAYVKYTDPKDAAAAIARLDNFKLPMSVRPMRVTASRNSCEIEVSNLPMEGCSGLEGLVQGETAAVTELRWVGATRVIIKYETHRDAAIARRFLLAALPDLCGRDVRVQLVKRAGVQATVRTSSHDKQAQHGYAPDSSQKVLRSTQQRQQQSADLAGQSRAAVSSFENLHVQTDNDFWFTSFPPPSMCGPVSTNKGPQWAWPQGPVASFVGSPIQQQPSTTNLWHY